MKAEKEIYLDNAATTRTLTEVAELMTHVMTEDYGNPSSLHGKGFDSEKYVRRASEEIAATLKVKPEQIIFTSGGTESNNHAIIGTALAYKRQGNHIITTATEHPSVSATCAYLEQQGFEITYLPVDEHGLVIKDELKNALKDETILVSIMTVNNEIGSIQDIEGLVKIVREYNEDIVFHTDAVQAYGKIPIFPKKWDIDLMSVSGHKIHGPKGIGFLFHSGRSKLHPYMHGGGQQKDRRSGTENVPGIAGLGLAAAKAHEDMNANLESLSELKAGFIKGLSDISDVVVHAWNEGADSISPYIVSVGIQGIKSEVLLHALEEKGIYVSSGSACSSNHPGISDTLTAIGVDKTYLDSTIRFSLSRLTTDEELSFAIEVLHELIPVLRRFTKR